MGFKLKKSIRDSYFGIGEFAHTYPDEDSCEKRLMRLKYPNGFICKACGHSRFYRLKGSSFKRNRLLQCAACKKQHSLTANTVFHGSKLPLSKWFTALFLVTQTKKGISGCLL